MQYKSATIGIFAQHFFTYISPNARVVVAWLVPRKDIPHGAHDRLGGKEAAHVALVSRQRGRRRGRLENLIGVEGLV
jgi:hypothetical protein